MNGGDRVFGGGERLALTKVDYRDYSGGCNTKKNLRRTDPGRFQLDNVLRISETPYALFGLILIERAALRRKVRSYATFRGPIVSFGGSSGCWRSLR